MSEFVKTQQELRANLTSQIREVIEGAESDSRGLTLLNLKKSTVLKLTLLALTRLSLLLPATKHVVPKLTKLLADSFPPRHAKNVPLGTSFVTLPVAKFVDTSLNNAQLWFPRLTPYPSRSTTRYLMLPALSDQCSTPRM